MAKIQVSKWCTKQAIAWKRTDGLSLRRDPLVVVANRLPVRQVSAPGGPRWETSPGGLVSALRSVFEERQFTWVGWPGQTSERLLPFEQDGVLHQPVGLSAREVEEYYEGFANGTIWPLFHDAIRPPEYHRSWWQPYVEVNRRFAETTAANLAPDGTAWIHDYHLQLVPKFLRELRPDAFISYFLHIPFPPEELFAQLPWRQQLLEGMLGADVIAFQTNLGAQNFSRLCRRFAGAQGSDELLKVGDRLVRVAALPISVDNERLQAVAAQPAVQARAQELKRSLGGRTIFLGVDRLDYTKGIDCRLRAYETFLAQHPDAVDNTVFLQVAVPSREKVLDYVHIRNHVEQLVGQINGAYATPNRTPIHYLYRNLPLEELVAYYLAADVMVVTPFRDGMNLVAKEYVSCRHDDSGVLILSEFTGAAKELQEALLVNPHDVDGVGTAFANARAMAKDERERRMASLRHIVHQRDVHGWAERCLEKR